MTNSNQDNSTPDYTMGYGDTTSRVKRLASSMRAMLKHQARKYGFDIVSYPSTPPDWVASEFQSIYQRNRVNTMVPWSGAYASFLGAKYVARNDVQGSVVECGVWKGGCSALLAETIQTFGVDDKTVYLFDTFEGMPEPGDHDRNLVSDELAMIRYEAKTRDGSGWLAVSIDDVRENLRTSKYPFSRYELIPGMVEATIPADAPDQIALLRLDTDWYESTKHVMEHLYPRLVQGGVLIVDDFGRWAGCRKAVTEYLAALDSPIFLAEDANYGAAIGIKQ